MSQFSTLNYNDAKNESMQTVAFSIKWDQVNEASNWKFNLQP